MSHSSSTSSPVPRGWGRPARALAGFLAVCLAASVPIPAAGQDTHGEARSLFEQALAAFSQGRPQDALYLLDQVETRSWTADQWMDWGPQSLRGYRSAYLKYLVGLERAIIGISIADQQVAARGGEAVEAEGQLSDQYPTSGERLAEEQTALARAIAEWGGWEEYSGSFRSTGDGPTFVPRRPTPQEVEQNRRNIAQYLNQFAPTMAAFDLPAPGGVQTTKFWFDNGGGPAHIHIEFQPVPGAASYRLEAEAWTDRPPNDYELGAQTNRGTYVVDPSPEGPVPFDLDWSGGAGSRWARLRLAAVAPDGGVGLPTPWVVVDWQAPNRQ